jgi:hypothetical protein
MPTDRKPIIMYDCESTDKCKFKSRKENEYEDDESQDSDNEIFLNKNHMPGEISYLDSLGNPGIL